MPAPHYAIAYTPPPDSPLARFGAGVLGYDGFQGAEVPHRAIPGIDPTILVLATVEPRRLGFHGGLVAPFGLGDASEDDLIEDLDRFARTQRPIPIGPLAVGAHDRCIVLRPAEPQAALDEFAASCRAAFEPLRAPLPAAGESAPPFRFFMTLAGPVPDSERKAFKALMRAAFERFAADQVEIDALSLLKQGEGESRFHVAARRRLTGR
jgi:hypothetical protein